MMVDELLSKQAEHRVPEADAGASSRRSTAHTQSSFMRAHTRTGILSTRGTKIASSKTASGFTWSSLS